MKHKKKGKSKKHAKRRSGLMVGAAPMAGKKKKHKAKKRSGFETGIDSWKKALGASAIMRLASGGVSYLAASQNMGKELPKVKMLFPLAVAIGANQNVIPIPGLFPAAVTSFVDAAVDNTQFLKDIFDFKFLQKSPAPMQTAGILQQLRPPMLQARSGQANVSPLGDYMDDRGAAYRH